MLHGTSLGSSHRPHTGCERRCHIGRIEAIYSLSFWTVTRDADWQLLDYLSSFIGMRGGRLRTIEASGSRSH